MNIKKRFVSLIIALVMVLQVTVTAFAETQSEIFDIKEGVNKRATAKLEVSDYKDVTGDGTFKYVALGDSITTGMGTRGEYFEYDEEKGEWIWAPNCSTMDVEYNAKHSPKTSYPYLVAQDIAEKILSDSELKSWDGWGWKLDEDKNPTETPLNNKFQWLNYGIPGYKVDEYYAAVADENPQDWSQYWWYYHGGNEALREDLKDSDLITVSIGANDLLQLIIYDMIELSGIYNDWENILVYNESAVESLASETGLEDEALMILAALNGFIELNIENPIMLALALAYSSLMGGASLDQAVTYAVMILAMSDVDTNDIMDTLVFMDHDNLAKRLGDCAEKAGKEYSAVIDKIKELNDKAQILLVSGFNPYGFSFEGNTSLDTYFNTEEGQKAVLGYTLPEIVDRIYVELLKKLGLEKATNSNLIETEKEFAELADENTRALLKFIGGQTEDISSVLALLKSMLNLNGIEQLEWCLDVVKYLADTSLWQIENVDLVKDWVKWATQADLDIQTIAGKVQEYTFANIGNLISAMFTDDKEVPEFLMKTVVYSVLLYAKEVGDGVIAATGEDAQKLVEAISNQEFVKKLIEYVQEDYAKYYNKAVEAGLSVASYTSLNELSEMIAKECEQIKKGFAQGKTAVSLVNEFAKNVINTLLNPLDVLKEATSVCAAALVVGGVVAGGTLSSVIDYYNYVANFAPLMKEGEETYYDKLPVWVGLDDWMEWSKAKLVVSGQYYGVLSGITTDINVVFDIDPTNMQQPLKYATNTSVSSVATGTVLSRIFDAIGDIFRREHDTDSKIRNAFIALTQADSVKDLIDAFNDFTGTNVKLTLSFGNDVENEVNKDVNISVDLADVIDYLEKIVSGTIGVVSNGVKKYAEDTAAIIASWTQLPVLKLVDAGVNVWKSQNWMLLNNSDARGVKQAAAQTTWLGFMEMLDWIDKNVTTDADLKNVDAAIGGAIAEWSEWFNGLVIVDDAGAALLNESLDIKNLLQGLELGDFIQAVGQSLRNVAGAVVDGAAVAAGDLWLIGEFSRIVAAIPFDLLSNLFTVEASATNLAGIIADIVESLIWENDWTFTKKQIASVSDIIDYPLILIGFGLDNALEVTIPNIASNADLWKNWYASATNAVRQYNEDTRLEQLYLMSPSGIMRMMYDQAQMIVTGILSSAQWAREFIAKPVRERLTNATVDALDNLIHWIINQDFVGVYAGYLEKYLGLALEDAIEFLTAYVNLMKATKQYVDVVRGDAKKNIASITNIIWDSTLELAGKITTPTEIVRQVVTSAKKLLVKHAVDVYEGTEATREILIKFLFGTEYLNWSNLKLDAESILALNTAVMNNFATATNVIAGALEGEFTYPIRYILMGMPANESIVRLNSYIEKYAATDTSLKTAYVDISKMPASSRGTNEDYSSWNPHPNDSGHKYIADQILAVLAKESEDNSDKTREITITVNGVPQTVEVPFAGAATVAMTMEQYCSVKEVKVNGKAVSEVAGVDYKNNVITVFNNAPEGVNVEVAFNYNPPSNPPVIDDDDPLYPTGGSGSSGGGGGLVKKTIYDDVETGRYWDKAIEWSQDYNIMDPVEDDHFKPYFSVTRNDMVLALYRAMKSPKVADSVTEPFTDVDASSEYYDAIRWAYKNGIVKGVTDTEFLGELECTRSEIVTLLWRFDGAEEGAPKTDFKDLRKNSFYEEAVKWAAENGIVAGVTDTEFMPNEDMYRVEALVVLYRYFVESL